MRTTLDLSDSLLEELEAEAQRQGVMTEELIIRYIKAGLRPSPLPHPRLTRSPIPVARRATGTPIPALRNAQMQQLIDEDDESF